MGLAYLTRRWRRRPVALARFGVGGVALVAVVAATLLGGLLRVRVDASSESFVPAHDPALAAVERKAREFGGDPVIVLLRYPQPRQFVREPNETVALLHLEGALAKLPDVATVYGPATVLNQLAGAAQDFIARIGEKREAARAFGENAAKAAGKSPAEIADAGQAAVDEVNYRYAPLLVRGLPLGMPTLRNSRFTEALMFGPDGLAKPDWRFIVPGTDTVAILVRPRQDLDQVSTQRLVDAVRKTVADANLANSTVTVSGVPTVSAELAGEVAAEAPLIGLLVALAVLLRYLLVPAPGTRWQRLRPLLASLLGSAVTLSIVGWLGYPLSFGAVVLLPLLLGVGSSFPLYLASVPNRRRVIVMSLASATAFLALAVSPLPFVRDLGFVLAAGICFAVAATLLLNRWWPPAGPDDSAPEHAPRTGWPHSLPVRAVALLAAVAVALVGWLALPRVNIAANPADLARGLPALADAKTVESTLGASGEIAVKLEGPDTLSPAALTWSASAQDVLNKRFAGQLRLVVGVPTLFGFLGPDPTPAEIDSALSLLPPYLSSAIVRPDRKVALLLYGVRLQDLSAQQRMLADVRAALPPPPPGFETDLVGLPVAAVRGYQLLLADRYLANLAGIALAGLVLLIGLRRRWDAIRAVVAALLATGWGLGVIWALGLALSPLTVALGSLVSVTGCEFSVLLAEARRRALPWLWRSVAIACLTSVLGYLALVPSRLWLVREFGLVLGAAVVLSYLAAKLVVWLAPPRAERTVEQEPAPDRSDAKVEVGA